MEPFAGFYHAVEKLSAGQAATAGGVGSGISIAAVLSVGPMAWVPWLQIATLVIGLLTGIASLTLVVMKLIQQHRTMRGR
jgi:hypothetical protein